MSRWSSPARGSDTRRRRATRSRSTTRAPSAPDDDFDRSLRPPTLADFVNQVQVTEQLGIFIEAARRREEALDHVLLAGPAGPRQDLARPHHRRRARGAAGADRGPGAGAQGRHRRLPDRARAGQRLLHRRDPPPRPRGRGDALPGDGGPPAAGRARPGGGGAHRDARPAAVHADRRHHPHRPADHAAARPLRRLPPARALRRRRPAADRHALGRDPRRSRSPSEGAEAIASRARGTPRVANRLLRRVRDFAEVAGHGRDRRRGRRRGAGDARGRRAPGSTATTASCCRRSPRSSAAGPVGLSTLAVAVGEEADTIEDVFEPYLLQQGLIKRTPRGRVLTERAYEHLGLPVPEGVASLF